MEKLKTIEKIDLISNLGVNVDDAIIYYSGDILPIMGTIFYMKYDIIKTYFKAEHNKVPERIKIIMNSFGGDAQGIRSGLDFIEDLRKQGVLVDTHAEGSCMSAATFIVAGGSGVRTSSLNCRWLVHELQLEGIAGTHAQVKNFQDELDFIQKDAYTSYAILTAPQKKKLTKAALAAGAKEWQQLCSKDFYFSAQEALKRGLVDKIV